MHGQQNIKKSLDTWVKLHGYSQYLQPSCGTLIFKKASNTWEINLPLGWYAEHPTEERHALL